MRFPDFLILGAQKAGTTALYDAVGQHPEIFTSPVKEPVFWGSDGDARRRIPAGVLSVRRRPLSPTEYAALFAEAGNCRMAGEACTDNLFSPVAAERLHRSVPTARLIIILRQPVERAFSSYCYARYNLGLETNPDFASVMTCDSERVRAQLWPAFQYRALGYYALQLDRFDRLFPPERICVQLYENWRGRPRAVLAEVFRFLGVDPSFMPVLRQENVSRGVRFENFHQSEIRAKILARTARNGAVRRTAGIASAGLGKIGNALNRSAAPALPPELKARLTVAYHSDLTRLQQRLTLDLTHWLV